MIYKPTYFYNQSVNYSKKINSPPKSSKKSEANRGGLDKISNELKSYSRVSSQDLINFTLSLNDPIYQCPSPTPEPTPTNPAYATIPLITDIP